MAVTDDFYIDNQPGAPFRAELNTILAALATANAGSTEPPNPQPGIMWLDTSSSPWALKRRNDKNTGWIKMYDTSNKPTKAEIGLGNVPNYPATSSLTDGSSNKLSTAKAAKLLEDQKLDKTAKAADSAKLGGVEAGKFAKQTGSYSGLRARATTKGDVGLGNVANYTVSSSITLNSNTSYALSSAVYTLNQNKLGKTSQAVDSAKLGGKPPTAFAPSVHSHSADNLPTGTTSAKGVLQILDSVTSTSTGYAAAPKSVKTAYDRANAAHSLASTANNRANAAMPKAGGSLHGTLNYTPNGGVIISLDGKTLLQRHTSRGGVSFGADDVLVIGSGESRAITAANVSLNHEQLHLSSDNVAIVRTNMQTGWPARKEFVFETDGGFKPANAAKTRKNLNVPQTGDSYLKSETYSKTEVNGKLPVTGYSLLSFGSVRYNSRYVKTNPFGNSTPVLCFAEVSIDNKWASAGWSYYASGQSFGTRAQYVQGEGIIVQTGTQLVMNNSAFSGGGHRNSSSRLSAPCRVHVWRLGV